MPRRGWSLTTGPQGLMTQIGLMAALDAGIGRAAVELQGEWTDHLKTPGRGTRYPAGLGFITKNGRVIPIKNSKFGRRSAHIASKPGDPPASDRGALAGAVQVERRSLASYAVGMGGRIGRRGLGLEYGINVPGSKVSRHPGKGFKIEARPHARPAKEAALGEMSPAMQVTMKRGIRKPRLTD